MDLASSRHSALQGHWSFPTRVDEQSSAVRPSRATHTRAAPIDDAEQSSASTPSSATTCTPNGPAHALTAHWSSTDDDPFRRISLLCSGWNGLLYTEARRAAGRLPALAAPGFDMENGGPSIITNSTCICKRLEHIVNTNLSSLLHPPLPITPPACCQSFSHPHRLRSPALSSELAHAPERSSSEIAPSSSSRQFTRKGPSDRHASAPLKTCQAPARRASRVGPSLAGGQAAAPCSERRKRARTYAQRPRGHRIRRRGRCRATGPQRQTLCRANAASPDPAEAEKHCKPHGETHARRDPAHKRAQCHAGSRKSPCPLHVPVSSQHSRTDPPGRGWAQYHITASQHYP